MPISGSPPSTNADPISPTANQVRVKSLGSGSSGNGFLIQHGDRTLMLDCGIGIRTINRELRALDANLESLDGVLITHEHIDHVRTLHRVLDHDIPIVATTGTADMADVPTDRRAEIATGRSVSLAGFTIWALGVRHDAIDPCGYLIEMDGIRVTILTDLGVWQDHLAEPVAASDLIVLEANHDAEMLRRGPYPMHLKRRVASDVGHLSNQACGEALASLAQGSHADPVVWLAHLSATNNRPEIAEQTVRAAIAMADLDLSVIALPRREPGPLWTPSTVRHPGTPFSIQSDDPMVAQLTLLDGFD